MSDFELTPAERKMIGDIREGGFTLGFKYSETFAAAASWFTPPLFGGAPDYILPFPCLLKNFWISGFVGGNAGIPGRIIPSNQMFMSLSAGDPPDQNPGFDPTLYGNLAANWAALTSLDINADWSGMDLTTLGLIFRQLFIVLSVDFDVAIGERADINLILRLERC